LLKNLECLVLPGIIVKPSKNTTILFEFGIPPKKQTNKQNKTKENTPTGLLNYMHADEPEHPTEKVTQQVTVTIKTGVWIPRINHWQVVRSWLQ